MMTLYGATETDFTHNGICILDKYCLSAEINQPEINGEYSLTCELMPQGAALLIANEMVIKADAPEQITPRLDAYSGGNPYEIWRVTTVDLRLNLRLSPDINSRVIHAYAPGTEVIVLDKSRPAWYEVETPDGNCGYMYASNLTYVKTQSAPPVDAGVIVPHRTRAQLFRISSITSTLDSVQITANHISYDLRRNYVKYADVEGESGQSALSSLLVQSQTPHAFRGFSDIAECVAEDIERTNPIAGLLSDGGLVDQVGGEVLRDNYDIFWMNHIGRDRGVTIAYRKNLSGMDVTVDTSNLVTRIIPVGFDKKNNPIYADPVDSPHIGEYAQPYVLEYEYKDVKIGSDYRNEGKVKAELARLAALEFDNGIDIPVVECSVDYIDLQNADGIDIPVDASIHLGDTIRLKHEDYGFDIALEVIGYSWDCLRNQYTSLTLSNSHASLSEIKVTPSMIGNSSLKSRKLAAGAITELELAENSVTSEQLQDGAVDTTDKLSNAVLNALDANAITALKAEIERIVAGEITTDRLYASIASIANAQIGTANIDYAHIKDLVAGSAIITEGIGGKLFISRLAVTEANIVSLSVGELLVKGSDGGMYALSVDNSGSITTTRKQIANSDVGNLSINAGEKLIEGSVTAACLNAQSIFADSAIIRQMIAANIDVDTLFAREATITALNTADIRGNSYLQMLVMDKADQSEVDTLGGRVTAAESSITMTANSIRAEVNGLCNANLLTGTNNTYALMSTYTSYEGHTVWPFEHGDDYPYKWCRYSCDRPFQAYCVYDGFEIGAVYTVSVDLQGYGNTVAIGISDNDRTFYNIWDGRISHTFTAMQGSYWLSVYFANEVNGNYIDIRRLKLEKGIKATDWCLSDNELMNSSVTIDNDGIQLKGGAIDIQAGSSFKVKSGGTVQIDTASGEDSHINLGDGNFSASKDGGVIANAGHFGSLDILGSRVMTRQDVVVSASQPTGHDVIWLKPSSVSSVSQTCFTASSRDESINLNGKEYITRTMNPLSSDTLPNGNITYSITIPYYSVGTTSDNIQVWVSLYKDSVGWLDMPTQTISIRPWQEVSVTFTVESSMNYFGDSSAIGLYIRSSRNGGHNLGGAVYVQKDTTLTLTGSVSGGAGTQVCGVYYVP